MVEADIAQDILLLVLTGTDVALHHALVTSLNGNVDLPGATGMLESTVQLRDTLWSQEERDFQGNHDDVESDDVGGAGVGGSE